MDNSNQSRCDPYPFSLLLLTAKCPYFPIRFLNVPTEFVTCDLCGAPTMCRQFPVRCRLDRSVKAGRFLKRVRRGEALPAQAYGACCCCGFGVLPIDGASCRGLNRSNAHVLVGQCMLRGVIDPTRTCYQLRRAFPEVVGVLSRS